MCEAAGFDVIIIETVGVGQSETAVHGLVDFFLLLLLAGAGDELQGIKRGIMEMADAVVVNKADGDNVLRAKAAAKEYELALSLFPAPDSRWTPRVLTCSAMEGGGIADIWGAMESYRDETRASGYFERRRQEQARYWMHESIDDELRRSFFGHPGVRAMLPGLEQEVEHGRLNSFSAARRLVGVYRGEEP